MFESYWGWLVLLYAVMIGLLYGVGALFNGWLVDYIWGLWIYLVVWVVVLVVVVLVVQRWYLEWYDLFNGFDLLSRWCW